MPKLRHINIFLTEFPIVESELTEEVFLLFRSFRCASNVLRTSLQIGSSFLTLCGPDGDRRFHCLHHTAILSLSTIKVSWFRLRS